MPRVTHTNYAKCTVWTLTMKTEIAGPRLACAIEIFRTLDSAQMERAITQMQKIHADRVALAAAQGERNAD